MKELNTQNVQEVNGACLNNVCVFDIIDRLIN